jgi:DNA replication protein DnaC
MKPIGEIMKRIELPTPAGVRASAKNTASSSAANDVCPICKGAGFVRIDAEVDSPNFSRLIQCTCKREERWQRSMAQLNDMSNMTLIRDWTFDSFDSDVPGAREAFEVTRAYADDPYQWLILIGDYGCGKTHLAAAIANHALSHLNMRPVFAVVPDLLDYLRSTFSPAAEMRYEARFDTVRGADLLVLDDLGTENTTPWAKEKLFQIINHRYMERLPTVVTTNVEPDRIDGRIRSRLFDVGLATAVFIEAGDFRTRGVDLRALSGRTRKDQRR